MHTKAADSSEAIPMEVDRVEKGHKGKGKGKKGKGKSGNWNIPWGAGRVLDVAEDRRAKERKAEDADQAKERTKERKEQKEKTIRRARLVQPVQAMSWLWSLE